MILSGVSFLEFCSKTQPLAQNGLFSLNFLFYGKNSWKLAHFSKWLHFRAKFKKEDPTWNQILLPANDHPTPMDHSIAWEWYRFGCSLTFTHLYLVISNLLPDFLITVTHSFFNIMSSVIPLNKNGGSGEKSVQVKILI